MAGFVRRRRETLERGRDLRFNTQEASEGDCEEERKCGDDFGDEGRSGTDSEENYERLVSATKRHRHESCKRETAGKRKETEEKR